MGNTDLLLSRVSSVEAFKGLISIWNHLLSNSKSNTVFLTWEWCTAWWECYGVNKALYILLVKDLGGEVVAIAPLYLSRRFIFGIPVRELRFIGDGSRDSVYLDFLVLEGKESESINSILSYLEEHKSEWDLACFNTTPASSLNVDILFEEVNKRGFFCQRNEIIGSYVDVPETWENYEKLLQKRFKERLRSRTRRLEKSHKIEFSQCKHSHELGEKLESLFFLHQKRWEKRNWAGVFRSPTRRRFYYAISRLLIQNNWLRFYSLKVDGNFVAHQFYMEYNNTLFWLIDGFDPDLELLEVGKIGRGYAFQDAISRGVKTFDFLGSISRYKRNWGGKPKTLFNIRFFQKGVKGKLIYVLLKYLNILKRATRRVVSVKAMNSMKLMIRRLLALFGIRIQ